MAGQVSLQWSPSVQAAATSADAATAVGYLLEAGRAPGGADIGAIPLGRRTTFTTPAPAGQYHVRIRAVNACGVGRASNDVIVTIP